MCSGPDAKEVQRAKGLCEDLLGSIKELWQRHKDNPRPYNGYGDRQNSQGYSAGYGAGYGNSYGGYGGYGASYGQSSSNTAQSPTAAPGTSGAGSPQSQQDYSAQWAQYFQQNPQYAAWYMAQQQQQAPGAPGASNDAPPPPPPSGSPSGGYNAV